jgi:dihydropteroate synthase
MSGSVYLRPAGPLTGPPAREAPEATVLRIGGSGTAFAALEFIERSGPGRARRRMLTVDDVLRRGEGSGERAQECRSMLSRLTSPRVPLAGLALDRPRIMGVVNVTPDSFSDGGLLPTAEAAIAHARQLAAEGADILDIGGESTRPGADPVPIQEELRRVMPVIEALAGATRALISIDTRNAEVMRQAAAAGAQIINDVSALQHDAESLRVVADTGLPVILMHAQGDPRSMQRDPRYDDVLLDVYDALGARVQACLDAGIALERLVVDPGIGFGKTAAHNLELLAGLSLFHGLGAPVLLGASRKSFIRVLTGAVDPASRLPGSIAAALSGILQGVHIVRVHDVAATRQALTIFEAAMQGTAG